MIPEFTVSEKEIPENLLVTGRMRAPLQPVAATDQKTPKSLSLLTGALTGLPTSRCGEGITLRSHIYMYIHTRLPTAIYLRVNWIGLHMEAPQWRLKWSLGVQVPMTPPAGKWFRPARSALDDKIIAVFLIRKVPLIAFNMESNWLLPIQYRHKHRQQCIESNQTLPQN